MPANILNEDLSLNCAYEPESCIMDKINRDCDKLRSEFYIFGLLIQRYSGEVVIHGNAPLSSLTGVS